MAHAQDCAAGWVCHRIYDGTSTDDLVMASLVRAWGPTDDVVLGYELKDQSADPYVGTFHVVGRRCSGASCASPSSPFGGPVQVGDRVLYQPMMPAMAIDKASGTAPLRVHVLLRDRVEEAAPFCGSTMTDYVDFRDARAPEVADLDLSHSIWSGASTGAVTVSGPWTVEATIGGGTQACEDRGMVYVRARTTGRFTACWRYNDGAGNPDRVHCGEELATAGTYEVDPVAPQGTDPRAQDHVGYDLDGSARILANHSVEGFTENIRVRLLDVAADPAIVLTTAPGADHPDVAVSSLGVYHVVWQEDAGISTKKIRIGRCNPAATNCAVAANWTVTDVASGKAVQYPQVTTDGNRQFVAYMEDVGTSSVRLQVRYTTRCGGGAFSSPVTVQAPPALTPERDQNLFWGRTHLAADRGDNVIHLAWVEADAWVNLLDVPTESDAWWAARTYTDCP